MSTNERINIVMRGAAFENKGAEAMIRTVQRELLLRGEHFNFILPCSEHNAQQTLVSGIIPVLPAEYRLSKYLGGKLSRSIVQSMQLLKSKKSGVIPANYREKGQWYGATQLSYCLDNIKNIDAVIDVSGFAYGDTWGKVPLNETLPWVEYCAKKSISYVFLPQSWGEFENTAVAKIAKEVLHKSSLYYARDTVSAKCIDDLMGTETRDVEVKPDIAFLFEGDDLEIGRVKLIKLGYDISTPIIGISPNLNIYYLTRGSGRDNEYVNLLIKICDYCTEKLGATVALIPNYIRAASNFTKDDRFICGIIRASVKKQSSCLYLREQETSELIKSVIGNLDLLIGSRYHSLVFGLSQSIPAISLSWSHKYRELFDQFGLGKQVVEYEHFNIDEIIQMLDIAWENRDGQKKLLQRKIPSIRADVKNMFNYICETVTGGTT